MASDPNNHHGSISYSEDESPFFADMTLDLAEAHDIAETPEPTRKTVIEDSALREIPLIPTIQQDVVGLALSPPAATASVPTEFAAATPTSPTLTSTSSIFDDENPPSELEMQTQLNSITNEDTHGRVALAYNQKSMTPSARKWPRDIPWAVAFCIVVPLSLLLPMLFARRPETNEGNPTENWLATTTAPRLATLHSLMWGYVASLILSRLLYRTMGGGDGDDARHVASQILLASAPISVSVYICLILTLYFLTPHALHYALIPLWYLARDIYLFRQWKMTATTPGGRQAFFQALTCMTLDILSRSLRRSSFYRIVSLLLVVQLFVIAWWRWAMLAALQSQSVFWICIAALGGKWATGTVARLLSLIASGGICSWFAEQNSLVEEMQQNVDSEETSEFTSDAKSDDGQGIPEAYRTAGASAYKSTLVPDEGMDDDFEDEEDEDVAMQPRNNGILSTGPRSSTVKQLLFSGLTISFGSVAKCGLLGGFAQFVWSQLRKIDTARATFGNLHGMSVGAGEENAVNRYLLQANVWAREFVRSHSDMAMSHVAAFQKSYHRAAQDVAILIDESGVEPIIHDDISTHISACVGGTISGVIVIFTGSVLVHQRNRNFPDVSDSAIVLDMLLAFICCYTLIFTVMEPLRASIKAVYVSFAQHPQSLSQAFPLIFHRLSRMSQSNLQ